jgi:acetyl-CoA C-acetyltransferase
VSRNGNPTPVIIGVGQVTDRSDDPTEARDPLTLIVDAIGEAAADAGIGAPGLAELDAIDVVNVVSWLYPDIAGQAASAVGAHPARSVHSDWGGNQPTLQVDRAAERVAAGESRLAVVCGAEAFRSMEKGLKSGQMPDWPSPPPDAQGIDVKSQVSGAAWAHGLRLPTEVYPLFENGVRHARGQSLAESQHESAVLWSAMSQVAAENPGSWLHEPRTAAEIETVSPDNRMVAFPYPKLMNALLSVNQGAAAIVADTETARRLGVPEDRWVYPWGGAGAADSYDFLARPGYDRSPAMEAALDGAFLDVGIVPAEIDAWELYSCFPCVPKMAMGHLGLSTDTPITVTGGLTFFGGPANDYMLHAVDAMSRRVRDGRASLGLLYGQGGFVTKHHALVLGREPRPDGFAMGGTGRDHERQAAVDAIPPPVFDDAPDGSATVETFTVTYDRSGAPERGIVVGRLESSVRFVANTAGGDTERLVTDDPIGATGTVVTGEGHNAFRF